MPTTKKENFHFGMMMCFGMVVFMTAYNLIINGLIGTVPLKVMLIQLILGFIIALLLELFIVGPVVAHKIVFSLPMDNSKSIFVILLITFFMVTGMVLSMSLFGLGTVYLLNSLGEETLLKSYYSIASKNFIFPFPLQLIIIGPTVRYLFIKVVKDQISVKPVEPVKSVALS